MNNAFNYKTAMFADCLTNSKEIYQLIDQVFPIDACRHYSVLPLKLEESNLVLGMLDPSNEESVKFANSIAKVFKYNLEIQFIDTQTHEIILASYPQSSSGQTGSSKDERQTIIDTSFNPNAPLKGAHQSTTDDVAPEIMAYSDHSESSLTESQLPDLPPDMDFLRDLDLKPQQEESKIRKKPDSTATLFEIPPEFRQQVYTKSLDDKATVIGGNPMELMAQHSSASQENQTARDEAKISALIAETLGTKIPDAPEKIADPDFLPQLAPQLSWPELLDQALFNQANYISLTRHNDRGSIIASQDEHQQSALKQVPLPIFCSLIDEIKRMARLPQKVTSHPRKVVFEKFHQQERVLLRLEFCLQDEQEVVNIQILRHKALEVYEQQQMDRISNQALQLAKQLEKSLRKIQACFDSAELNNLREIQTIHSRINHQLRLLDRKI